MYSSSFYITDSVWNNAFSFEKRENKKLYVPNLIKGGIDDVEIGDNIVFEDFDFEWNLQSCFWLKNFYEMDWKGKKVFLFDNHNHAFYFWCLALKEWIIRKGSYLFHMDEHSDMRDSWKYLSSDEILDLERVFEFTNFELNVGDYIVPAVKSGLVGKVVQIRGGEALNWILSLLPSPQPSPLRGEVEAQIEDRLLWKGDIIFNLDLDFFRPELDFIDYDLKKEVVLKIAEKAKVITVASSPFFIEQKLALKVFKDLFVSS